MCIYIIQKKHNAIPCRLPPVVLPAVYSATVGTPVESLFKIKYQLTDFEYNIMTFTCCNIAILCILVLDFSSGKGPVQRRN